MFQRNQLMAVGIAGACAFGATVCYLIMESSSAPRTVSAVEMAAPDPVTAAAKANGSPESESAHSAVGSASSFRPEIRTLSDEQLREAQRSTQLARSHESEALVAAAPLPAAFQPIDGTALGLTEEQVAEVGDLQKQFLEEVETKGKAVGEAPSTLSPGRWRQAVRKSDAELRARLGTELAETIQTQAAQAGEGGSPSRRK